MNNEYWLKRWKENRIGFHKDRVNPFLERFLPQVISAPGRTLVPLCGKSADLAWLVERGHDVVGVDISDLAARAFASEQKIPVTVVQEPPFTILRGKLIEYRVGDFFSIEPSRIGHFDLIYDRAALIALPAETRPAYVRKLNALMTPGAHILLISLEYDPKKMEGPPFSIPESEVRALFANRTFEKLYQHDCLEEEAHFKERGLDWMKEVVYHIH